MPSAPRVAPETPKERKLRLRRERVRAQVQGLLEPGEQIQAMFVSQTGPSPRGALTWVPAAQGLTHYWNVAVTDRNIVLSPVEALGGKGSKRFLRRLPREPFEMLEGKGRRWWFPISMGGERHFVSTEEYDLVAATNDMLRSSQEAPPPPPPPPPPAPAPSASTPRGTEAATPAAWYPDPSNRHQVRYWDGRTWTAEVADQGVRAVDPVKAA